MALYAISDLHLSFGVNKPMNVFGEIWENYENILRDNWQKKIKQNDLIVIPGDISWATYVSDTALDFDYINRLNGQKIILKGNHDYWWTTLNKLKVFLEEQNFSTISFLHNNHFEYGGYAICGTRGWVYPKSAEDEKLSNREIERLKLSLESAGEQKKIVFLHYPPCDDRLRIWERYNEIFHQYHVEKVFYGHLHAKAQNYAFEGKVDGVEYKLVSCDYLQFDPYKILD